MPKVLRTDTRVSGGPGIAPAISGCICGIATFIRPPLPPDRAGGVSSIIETSRPAAKGQVTHRSGANRRPQRRALPSDQFVRSEEIIGLDDLAQFFFRRAVPAVGVGMVAFHQFLIAGLD